MGFSTLADMGRRIPDGGRSVPRDAAVTGFGLHHNAGVNAWGEASRPGREVSANYWIANDGALIPNIDETRRAFTSGAAGYPAGAAADHRNITVEISNTPYGVSSGTWEISAAAMGTLIALIADVYRRYGLGPVLRGADKGIGVHRDWVPTECPGPYVMANLGYIIAEAETLRSNGGSPGKQDIVIKTFRGATTRKKAQKITGNGDKAYLTFRDSHDVDAWGDRTLARGPGVIVSSTINVAMTGEPGTRVAFTLVCETGQNKNRSRVAAPRGVVDSLGKLSMQIGYERNLKRGDLIRLLAQVQNGKTVEVTQFYWSGSNTPGVV